jgi:acyl-CoA thioester hydrolase
MALRKITKVYLADTDATGFVYYARYLEWMEAARLDLLSETGTSLIELIDQGVSAVVRNVICNYAAPIRLGDEVEILTSVSKLAKTNVIISYEFNNLTTGNHAGTGEVSIVFIDANTLRPARIPKNITNSFNKHVVKEQVLLVNSDL